MPLDGGVKCRGGNRPRREAKRVKEEKKMSRLREKTTAILLIAVFLAATIPMLIAGIVTPDYIEDELYPGDVEEDTITVELPDRVPKGDVVFLFDTTGSMDGIIDDMQTKAVNLMNAIRTSITDTHFGVGSHGDYPDYYTSYGYADQYGYGLDYAFTLNQDITADTSVVETAIDDIVYTGGGDGPECISRAVWETLSYSWRDGAKRIVVYFGDAPPHSAPSGDTLKKPWATTENLFYGSYGGDPGPDEVIMNGDDLDFGPVVQQASSNHITFIVVDCQSSSTGSYADDTHNGMEYLAYMTGGSRFAYTATGIDTEIVNQINALATQPISVLTLSSASGWVAWTPTAYNNVPWGSTKTFDVTITIPGDATPDDYTIYIDVLADGVTLDTVEVLKHVLEPTIEVDIDIKPGSDPNSINTKNKKGVIAVAVFTTDDFDVSDIDHSTVVFGPDSAEPDHKNFCAHMEDIDGDGDLDVVYHFRCQETGLAPDDTEAYLRGLTNGGTPIEGVDSVRIVK